MKRRNYFVGLGYLVAGVVFFFLMTRTEGQLASLMAGFGGACVGPGLYILWRTFYWRRKENAPRYAQKLAAEHIERHDEFKEKLRDRAGRYAYILAVCLVGLSTPVFGVLDAVGIVEGTAMVYYLCGLLAVLMVSGELFYRRLLKKYE